MISQNSNIYQAAQKAIDNVNRFKQDPNSEPSKLFEKMNDKTINSSNDSNLKTNQNGIVSTKESTDTQSDLSKTGMKNIFTGVKASNRYIKDSIMGNPLKPLNKSLNENTNFIRIPIKKILLENNLSPNSTNDATSGTTKASNQYGDLVGRGLNSAAGHEVKIKERNPNATKINTSWNGSKQNGGRPQINSIITERIKNEGKLQIALAKG